MYADLVDYEFCRDASRGRRGTHGGGSDIPHVYGPTSVTHTAPNSACLLGPGTELHTDRRDTAFVTALLIGCYRET